jgi:thiol-disulfide isomerase/thioredoxin
MLPFCFNTMSKGFKRLSNLAVALVFTALILQSGILLASTDTDTSRQDSIPVISFSELQNLMDQRGDTLYILNFWATWCKPCIMELPDFERIHREYTYDGSKVKVLLISLDFPEKINTSLIPFLNRNNIASEVWVLDEPDANAWIDRVDPSWSGAIPATLFLHKNLRHFHEGTMTYEELLKTINNPKLKL